MNGTSVLSDSHRMRNKMITPPQSTIQLERELGVPPRKAIDRTLAAATSSASGVLVLMAGRCWTASARSLDPRKNPKR